MVNFGFSYIENNFIENTNCIKSALCLISNHYIQSVMRNSPKQNKGNNFLKSDKIALILNLENFE